MADFCTCCVVKMLFGDDIKQITQSKRDMKLTHSEFIEWVAQGMGDIDVFEIFHQLKPGEYLPVLCEGCGMLAVYKDPEDVDHIKVFIDDSPICMEKNRKVDFKKDFKNVVIAGLSEEDIQKCLDKSKKGNIV